MSLESNLWKLVLVRVFRSFFFFAPIAVLFWQENGLSMTEVMLLQSFWALGYVILEIPTGYFADVFGRKFSISLGTFFSTLGFFFYSFGDDFLTFLIAELTLSLGGSLVSGADLALLYDTLKNLGKEEEYKKYAGNITFYSLIGLSLSSVLGGFIASFGLRKAVYASVPPVFLSFLVSLTLVEPKYEKYIFKKGYLREIFKVVRDYVLRHHEIRNIILLYVSIFALYQSSMWLYQPYYKEVGIPIFLFGILFALYTIVAAFISKKAYLFQMFKEKVYLLLSFFTSLAYFGMYFFFSIYGVIFSYLHQIPRGVLKIFITDEINKRVPSKVRATVLSVANMTKLLGYALVIPFFGKITDVFGLRTALLYLGILSLLLGTFSSFVLPKKFYKSAKA